MRIPVRLAIALSLAVVMIASAGLAAATKGSDPAAFTAPRDSGASSGGAVGSMPGGSPGPSQPGDIAIAPEGPCGQTETSGTGDDGAVSYRPCPGDDPTDQAGHAQAVVPTPGMSDVRPVGWVKAVVGPDDRTLTLRFWSGVEPCSVLDHVDVASAADAVTITLFQGSDPTARDVACIDIATLKQTTITLDQPLAGRPLVDGART